MVYFELMVGTLLDFWDNGDEDLEERQAAFDEIVAALGDVSEEALSWQEEPRGADSIEGAPVDPYCLFALRALAAHLEARGTIEGFEVGEEPWEHPVYEELDPEGDRQFEHLLNSDADMVIWAPIALPEVLRIGEGEEDAEEADEDSGFVVAALPGLIAELARLNEVLQVPEDAEDPELPIFDPEQDPLAAAKWGLVELRGPAQDAADEGVSLFMVLVDEDEEEDDEDDDEDDDDEDEDDKVVAAE